MKRINVAVVGCGNISVMHLDSIIQFQECSLVAVCDIKKYKA